ncbi:MAG: glycosyltransferase family protein [Patescibacteria group bacterium]
MKFTFFVQGEGRGHLIQAITLKEQLEKRGHLISAVFVSSSPARKLPDFFAQRMGITPKLIGGPVFIADKNGKGVSFWRSLFATLKNSLKWPKYFKEIAITLNEENPDVIVSFYEPLSGLYRLISNKRRPFFLIGHQFFVEHPSFIFPKKRFLEKKFFIFYNRLLSLGGAKKIALSFCDAPNLIEKNLFVCPPLIRGEIKNFLSEHHNYIMAYLLNHGYSEEIENWCKKNPGSQVEAFSDQQKNSSLENLHFNPINDVTFAECLRNCSIYLSTAGFESICEAAYLDKNIIMVPTKNHYEQLCNAHDAERVGVAIMSDTFNPDILLDEKKAQLSKNRETFKNWADLNSNKIISILENVK